VQDDGLEGLVSRFEWVDWRVSWKDGRMLTSCRDGPFQISLAIYRVRYHKQGRRGWEEGSRNNELT
jgi:hypothetical protein